MCPQRDDPGHAGDGAVRPVRCASAMTPAPVALCGVDLCKRFPGQCAGKAVQALDHVRLTIAADTLSALVGAHGAGKTTLLRIAPGLMRGDSGKITVTGCAWCAVRARRRRRLPP